MVFVTDVPIFAPITIGIAYSAVSCCFFVKKNSPKMGRMESFQMGNIFYLKNGESWSARKTRDLFR